MSDIATLIENYILLATKFGILTDSGEKTTKEDPELRKIARILFKMKKIDLLKPLLNHQNPYVRLYAAVHLYPFYEVECYKVLKELMQNENSIAGFDAKWTLRSMDNGTFKLSIYD